jgi:hypothetical protein
MSKGSVFVLIIFLFPLFAHTQTTAKFINQVKDTSQSIFKDTTGNVLTDVVLVGSRSGYRSLFGSTILLT